MSASPGWPADLTAGPVQLRPPRYRDAKLWSEIRLRNRSWLEPWEPTSSYSWYDRNNPAAWRPLCRALRSNGRSGTMLPFMMVYGGRLAGQMNASNVVHGALRSCTVGYWIDAALAGRNITPTALALLMDHCFTAVGLHRVEVDIRPENQASIRVVEKLGLRREGYYERFLDIAGGWRDHLAFAITVEELRGGRMLDRVPALPEAPSSEAAR